MRIVLALAVTSAAACTGQGTFTPGDPDAGVDGNGGPTAADIGKVCTYNHDGKNPTNTCPKGLACIIVTSDNAYRYEDGAGLPLWEDQFTIYGDSADTGYCTLKGTTAAPPACPQGTVLKVLTQDITVCLRTCNGPEDCDEPGYTCDVRYLDTPDKLCVRACGFDVPDCVRSGVFQFQQDPQGTLRPALSLEDLSGASQCGVDNGICGVADHATGHAAPGEPCVVTNDCEVGSACMQSLVVGSVLGVATTQGFCASPCNPVVDPAQNPGAAGTCSTGFVCQSAGRLNLGFLDPPNGVTGPFTIDSGDNLDERGGFCFHQCAEGVQGNCDAFFGTKCGSLNESLVADTWNQQPMCLPTAIAN